MHNPDEIERPPLFMTWQSWPFCAYLFRGRGIPRTTSITTAAAATATTTTAMAASWLIYAATLLATTVMLFKAFSAHHRRHRQLNLPPGPKPWPIIGNLNLMGPVPHRSLHALSLKYGPLMQLRFGSIPVIVISSAEMAKQILKTHDLNFANRPKTAAGKHIFYDRNDMAFSSYGAYWRQARKVFLTELLSTKRLDSFDYIRVEEVKSLISELIGTAGKPVEILKHLSCTTLNIIRRMAIGKVYLGDAEQEITASKEMTETIRELFVLSGVLNIGDYIPWLDFMDLQGYVKRMKAVNKAFDVFLEHVLDERSKRRAGKHDVAAKDIVDILLNLIDDPNLDVKLTRTSVKCLIMDLLAGGSDTTAVTLEWAISELVKRPETIEEAAKEIDKVVGRGRWVEEKDILELPYIEAIAKETMRMHPAGTLLAPHYSQEDCTIDGYDVRAGTIAIMNVWAIGRDPRIWVTPNEFRPERFIGKVIDTKGKDFELLPFGSGRRMCPGYGLALKVFQLILANLIHGFVWKLPQDKNAEELDMDEIFGLVTARKVPLMAIVEPRLSSHLYNF